MLTCEFDTSIQYPFGKQNIVKTINIQRKNKEKMRRPKERRYKLWG